MGEVILYFLAGWGATDIIMTVARHIAWPSWARRNHRDK